MDVKAKKFKRIYNISLISLATLYIAALVVISFISEQLDKGGFFEFNFPFYLLVFTLISAPFALLIVSVSLIVKEFILYKKFKCTARTRFISLTVMYFLMLLISIFSFLGLALGIMDVTLMIIIALTIACAILMIVACKKKK